MAVGQFVDRGGLEELPLDRERLERELQREGFFWLDLHDPSADTEVRSECRRALGVGVPLLTALVILGVFKKRGWF